MPRKDIRTVREWLAVIESIENQVEESDAVLIFLNKINRAVGSRVFDSQVILEINDFEAAVLVQAGHEA